MGCQGMEVGGHSVMEAIPDLTWMDVLLRLAVCWPPPHQKAMHWCRLPWEVVEALPLELFEKWDLWHWGMWFSAVTGVG